MNRWDRINADWQLESKPSLVHRLVFLEECQIFTPSLLLVIPHRIETDHSNKVYRISPILHFLQRGAWSWVYACIIEWRAPNIRTYLLSLMTWQLDKQNASSKIWGFCSGLHSKHHPGIITQIMEVKKREGCMECRNSTNDFFITFWYALNVCLLRSFFVTDRTIFILKVCIKRHFLQKRTFLDSD